VIMHKTGSTALVADHTAGRTLMDRLSAEGVVIWNEDIGGLLRQGLSSAITVLVVRARPLGQGLPLALLAWINLEYPRIQKVAVVEGPLPLPIVRFLTSCGVELVWTKSDDNVEHIVSVVDRLQGRSSWIAPWCQPVPHVRTELEAQNDHA